MTKVSSRRKTKKKELLLEAKEDIIRAKNDNERDMKERRAELTQLEKRLGVEGRIYRQKNGKS